MANVTWYTNLLVWGYTLVSEKWYKIKDVSGGECTRIMITKYIKRGDVFFHISIFFQLIMTIGKLRKLCLLLLLATSMGGLVGQSLVRERTTDPGRICVDITQKAYFLQFNTYQNFTFKFGSRKGIRLFLSHSTAGWPFLFQTINWLSENEWPTHDTFARDTLARVSKSSRIGTGLGIRGPLKALKAMNDTKLILNY